VIPQNECYEPAEPGDVADNGKNSCVFVHMYAPFAYLLIALLPNHLS